MKTIVVTGGGSGGHIAPIRAIAPELSKDKKIYWLGSSYFEEQAAIELGIDFKKISSGKIRRDSSWKAIVKNIIDLFRVEFGGWQSLFFMIRKKPEYVFSTGGFVSVPVVIAAWFLRIPIVIHEQTIGFGLANQIGAFCARTILLGFSESQEYIPQRYHHKIQVVGNPIRSELTHGTLDGLEGFLGTKLSEQKPIIYITGGGQGSKIINTAVFEILGELTKKYYVIHQTGKQGIKTAMQFNQKDYFPCAFIGDELADMYRCADIVVARAGAGTVNELDYFGIYSIFVPLRPVQNDEQTKNAEWFLEHNDGDILDQDVCDAKNITAIIERKKILSLRRNEEITKKENDARELILEILSKTKRA